ncbi:MAG: hypothetical protein ACRDHE_14600 [Ktedonobacterales bacterium]
MAEYLSGLFPTRTAAERAVAILEQAGFSTSQIGVLFRAERSMPSGETGVSEEGQVTIGADDQAFLARLGESRAVAGTRYIAGGLLARSLGEAHGGNIVEALAGMGVPKAEAERHASQVDWEVVMVVVDATGREELARQTLRRAGAENLDPEAVQTQNVPVAGARPISVEPIAPPANADTQTGSQHDVLRTRAHSNLPENPEATATPETREDIPPEHLEGENPHFKP